MTNRNLKKLKALIFHENIYKLLSKEWKNYLAYNLMNKLDRYASSLETT